MALVLRSPTDAPPVQRWKQAYSSSTEEDEDIQEAAGAEPDMNNTAEQQEAEQCKYPRKPTRQASRLSKLLWKMSLSATILTLDLSPDQPEAANMRRLPNVERRRRWPHLGPTSCVHRVEFSSLH